MQSIDTTSFSAAAAGTLDRLREAGAALDSFGDALAEMLALNAAAAAPEAAPDPFGDTTRPVLHRAHDGSACLFVAHRCRGRADAEHAVWASLDGFAVLPRTGDLFDIGPHRDMPGLGSLFVAAIDLDAEGGAFFSLASPVEG